MRKLATLILFGIIFQNATGQITISNSNMPYPGDTMRFTITNDLSIDPTISGQSVTWDYSFLTPFTQRVDTVFAVGDTPTAYRIFFENIILYPDHYSNYSMKGRDIDLFGTFTLTNVFDFYKINSGNLQHTGFGATLNGIPMSIRNDTIENVYEFPLQYGSNYNSSAYFEMQIPNLGFYSQHKALLNNVEGEGTLILPNYSFSCIKLKREIVTTDSVYIDSLGFGQKITRPLQTEYWWISTSYGLPVMKVTVSNIGVVTTVEYFDDLINVGISQNDHSMVSVYPNPAANQISITNVKKLRMVEVYDGQGKMIISKEVKKPTESCTIDVSQLSMGTYICLIHSEEGVFQTKFIKEE